MEVNLPLLLCFTLYLTENFPSASPRGGLYLEGRFNGGIFVLPVWGAYIWRGLFSEFSTKSSQRITSHQQSVKTLSILTVPTGSHFKSAKFSCILKVYDSTSVKLKFKASRLLQLLNKKKQENRIVFYFLS